RKLLLLYPKSTLVPIISANAAALNLRMENFQKALSFYESARQDFPFYNLHFEYQAGIGEATFGLHDFAAARHAFGQVLQKCQDTRSRMMAELRLADMDRIENKTIPLKTYEKYAEKSPILVGRISPWVFFNAGEIKYSQGQYSSAKFYFNEYLRYEG